LGRATHCDDEQRNCSTKNAAFGEGLLPSRHSSEKTKVRPKGGAKSGALDARDAADLESIAARLAKLTPHQRATIMGIIRKPR